MSDFESRLAEALRTSAEGAPEPHGLAAGARTRARTRRRTRYVVGAALAAVVVAVPVGVLTLGDGDEHQASVATDPTTDAPGGWQTVEHEGVLVDVPGDWECRSDPPGSDVCTHRDERLTFYHSAIYDPAAGPGLYDERSWMGYVYTGDWAVFVEAANHDEALRILGSARVDGETAPDLSAGWRTVRYSIFSADVPATWQDGGPSAWCLDPSVPGWVANPTTDVRAIGCTPRSGYGLVFAEGTTEGSKWPEATRQGDGRQHPEGAWVGHLVRKDVGGHVTVVAPTQALALLILSTVSAE